MFNNKTQRSVKIISELMPQNFGNFNELTRTIVQSKFSGADFVKLQLYSSEKIWNDNSRKYLEVSKTELKEIYNFCKNLDIELTASVFDEEKLDWCESLDFKTYKIASRVVRDDKKLCEKIISTSKNIYASLGFHDIATGAPFKNKNVKYLYCVSNYPTNLYDINMPNFDSSFMDGFSDHSIGIDACLFAISRGATVIEKHFSNNKSLGIKTDPGHAGSMNSKDLEKLRSSADSITLLRSSIK